MIFVDSNIPMYLAGNNPEMKERTQQLVEGLVLEKRTLVTSAEVLQEIVHRYHAINRREAIAPIFEFLHQITDRVFDITEADARLAAEILDASPRLSARDALHVATMRRLGIRTILSYDRGFDQVVSLKRLPE